MKKFLIQSVNGKIVYDFSFHLIKAIEFNNWFRNEKVYDYILSETIIGYPECIPIGSLDFVFDYLEAYENIERKYIKPINVPMDLLNEKYTKRKIEILNKEDINIKNEVFVKSNTNYKKITDVISNTNYLPEDEYFVSEVIDIESEWRCFIYLNQLVGLKHYIGDFKLFPDINKVEEMILNYKNSPNAYTLDVGINSNKEVFVIEVHPFVSCGLYGFEEYNKLPIMMIEGYRFMKKEAENLQNKGEN